MLPTLGQRVAPTRSPHRTRRLLRAARLLVALAALALPRAARAQADALFLVMDHWPRLMGIGVDYGRNLGFGGRFSLGDRNEWYQGYIGFELMLKNMDDARHADSPVPVSGGFVLTPPVGDLPVKPYLLGGYSIVATYGSTITSSPLVGLGVMLVTDRRAEWRPILEFQYYTSGGGVRNSIALGVSLR
jgi:hypothetical protein